MVWIALVACGGTGGLGDELRSVPATPTRDLTPRDEPSVVFTELGELFPATPAALPPPLATVTPRMAGPEARAVLEGAREPGARIFGRLGDTQLAQSSIIAGYPEVGLTFLFDAEGKELQEVSLSLPHDVAVPMLTTRWGRPTEQVPGDGAQMTLRWVPASGPWLAELVEGPRTSVLRYRPRAEGR